jgi:hypothetical protein
VEGPLLLLRLLLLLLLPPLSEGREIIVRSSVCVAAEVMLW